MKLPIQQLLTQKCCVKIWIFSSKSAEPRPETVNDYIETFLIF